MCDADEAQEPESRHVYLFGEMEPEQAADAAEAIVKLSEEDRKEPVHLHLVACPGGNVMAAMALVDIVQAAFTAPVYTYAWGEACSSAVMILAAGTRRKVSRNAVVMVHGFALGLERQSTKAMTSAAAGYAGQEAHVYRWLAHATGHMDRDYWLKRIAASGEVWFDAEGAVEQGLADLVIEAGDMPRR